MVLGSYEEHLQDGEKETHKIKKVVSYGIGAALWRYADRIREETRAGDVKPGSADKECASFAVVRGGTMAWVPPFLSRRCKTPGTSKGVFFGPREGATVDRPQRH